MTLDAPRRRLGFGNVSLAFLAGGLVALAFGDLAVTVAFAVLGGSGR